MPKGTFVVNDWGSAEKSGSLGDILVEKPADDGLLSAVSSVKYAHVASSTAPATEPTAEGLGAAAVTGYLDIEDDFYPFIVLVDGVSSGGTPEGLHSLCRVISNLLPNLADKLEKQPEVLPEKCLSNFFHAVYARLKKQALERDACRISLQLAYKDRYGNAQCLAVSDDHNHPGVFLVQEPAHSSLDSMPNTVEYTDSATAIRFRYARVQLKPGARLFALSSLVSRWGLSEVLSENSSSTDAMLSKLLEVFKDKAGLAGVSEPFVMAEILYPKCDERANLKAAITAKASEAVFPVVLPEEGAADVASCVLTSRTRTFSINTGSSSFYSMDLVRFPETQKILTAAAALKAQSFGALTTAACREIETQLTVLKNCCNTLKGDGYSPAESYLAQLVSLAFEIGYRRFIEKRSDYNAASFKVFKAVPKPTLDFARIFQAIQLVREVNTWFSANKKVISKTVGQYLQASLFQLAANLQLPYSLFSESDFVQAIKQFNLADPRSAVAPESLLKAYKGEADDSLASIVTALKGGADVAYNLLRPAKSSAGAVAETLEAAPPAVAL